MKLRNRLWLLSAFIVVSHATIAAENEQSSKEPSSKDSKSTTVNNTGNTNGIYRNVNEDGVVEFSDQSVSNSEKIKLKSINTFKSADKKITPKVVTKEVTEAPSVQRGVKYTKFSISSPTPDQQIRSNDGLLTVSISIDPALNVAGGDQIELYYDGRSQGKQKTTVFNLKDVFRGQHRIQAKIIDKNGTVLEISNPIQFVIHKYSVLNKPKPRTAP